MAQELQHAFGDAVLTTKDLYGRRVFQHGKNKLHKVGKIRNLVFHPSEKRLIGVLIKRPDAAMMFHRKDVFLRWDGFEIIDGDMVIFDKQDATDKAACKYLGVNFNDCILWWNMPLATADGTKVGEASQISFDSVTGKVISVTADNGAASGALLGKKEIPAELIRGFKKGLGQEKALTDEELKEAEQEYLGAILVDDSVLEMETQGGMAERAGAATAVAAAKVRVVRKAAKPKVDEAAQAAGNAAEKGLFATGRQLGRASGMFASFKEEYDKARNSDD